MINFFWMNLVPEQNNFAPHAGAEAGSKQLLRQQVALLYALSERKRHLHSVALNRNDLIRDNERLKKRLQYMDALLNQVS